MKSRFYHFSLTFHVLSDYILLYIPRKKWLNSLFTSLYKAAIKRDISDDADDSTYLTILRAIEDSGVAGEMFTSAGENYFESTFLYLEFFYRFFSAHAKDVHSFFFVFECLPP